MNCQRLFLAMTKWQLGQQVEARKLLAEILPAVDRELDFPASEWNRRATLEILRREAEALAREGALCETRSITVRSVVGEEYPRIIGYDLGPKPAWREPGMDGEAGEETFAYADEGDLPF